VAVIPEGFNRESMLFKKLRLPGFPANRNDSTKKAKLSLPMSFNRCPLLNGYFTTYPLAKKDIFMLIFSA
jgi:hypothetical protein